MAIQKRRLTRLKIMVACSIVIFCVLICSDFHILQQLSNEQVTSTDSYNNDGTDQATSIPNCQYGVLSQYGIQFDHHIPIRIKKNKYINISHALGCSKNAKYCKGKIKAIPCCIKIMYDMWYALDEYLTKYNVTYSIHWGSLLFAVRDGRHGEWDAKDIDLAFLWPLNATNKAIAEYRNEYGLSMDGIHHIVDWKQNFYRLHHNKYGYPSSQKMYCFYNQVSKTDHTKNDSLLKIEYKKQLKELLDNEDALILGGTNAFIDYVSGITKTDGMGNNAKYIEDNLDLMIQVQYNGSNGILPPRKIYIFPDYYKQLYQLYVYPDWANGYDVFLTNKQLRYYGMNKYDNSYFKTIYGKTMEKLNTIHKYKQIDDQNKQKFDKFKRLEYSLTKYLKLMRQSEIHALAV